MDGMFALATDREQLYFHPLASISEYAVPLSVINNRTNFMESVDAMPYAFRAVGKRSSSCAAQAMDSHNNLYCVTFNPIKLTRWSPNKPYNVKYEMEIPADPQLLEFVSGMKVYKNDAGKEELWMISNRFQVSNCLLYVCLQFVLVFIANFLQIRRKSPGALWIIVKLTFVFCADHSMTYNTRPYHIKI